MASLVVVAAPTRATPSATPTASAASPTASGRFLRSDGKPLTGGAVSLTPHVGVLEVIFSTLFIGLSGGLGVFACLGKDPGLPICKSGSTTVVRIAADGTWSAPLESAYSQYDLFVTNLSGPAAGATVVQYRFDVHPPHTTLPTVRLWDSRFALATRAGDLNFSWQRLPASYTTNSPRYEVTMQPRREDGPTGRVLMNQTTASINARWVEDVTGHAVVTAKAKIGQGLTHDVIWTATPMAYPAPAGAPLSRKRPCSVVIGTGAAHRSPACWVTDGKFGGGYPKKLPQTCGNVGGERQCAQPPVAVASIDLGRAEYLGDVLVRGCLATCLVETSLNGRTWSSGVSVDRDEFAVPNLKNQRARFVRVQPFGTPRGVTTPVPFSADSANDLSSVREVSVWAGTPPPPPKPPAAKDAPAAGSHTHASHGSRWWAVVIAALLLVALAGGIRRMARRQAPAV